MQEKEKQALIKSLIEEPSTYEIEVQDNSMLPASLIDEETVTITIKPPTLEVLSKCAQTALSVPENIRTAPNVDIEEALKFKNEMVKVLSIMAHGSKKGDIPEWYEPFFLKNLTGKELYILFYESILKMQTDFFLSSFQIVNQNNPMMMNQKNDSIPTG